MNGIYRSRDIEKETGLSRKDLLYYRRKGVITPVGTETKGNHNLYDEVAFMKLRKAAILRRIQMNIEDIECFLGREVLNREEILEKLIINLKKGIEDLKDKLSIAVFIKENGFESMDPYMSVKGYEELVSKLKKERNM